MIFFDHYCLRSAHVGPLNTLRTLALVIGDLVVYFETMAVEIQVRKQGSIATILAKSVYTRLVFTIGPHGFLEGYRLW